MRLEQNEEERRLRAKADSLEAEAKTLRQEASDLYNGRLKQLPLIERLVFAADSRCPCGAGMAYDPTGEVTRVDSAPFHSPSAWDCSRLLLNAPRELGIPQGHDHLPFAFYEVKSENQPSAHGRTTRPTSVAA